ncbi:MAG: NUDIX domain-containing protein [Acidimicrobiales bacterium]
MPSAEGPDSDTFRKIGERGRHDVGFFSVVTATFVGPDGFTFERDVVRHPGAVCAVPLEADRRHVLMIRQYRGAIDEMLLELPAGKRDVDNEDPGACMARELVEEIGRQAQELTEIARFYNSPGFSDEQTICYLAEGLTECPRDARGIEEQHMTVEPVLLDDVDDLLARGVVRDAKSIIGLVAARAIIAGARAKSSQPSIFGAQD